MPSDNGNQTVTVKYHDPVDSYLVNERHDEIRARGIYSGGHVSIVNENTGAVSLSPLVCEIGDANYQVKVKTTSVITTDSYGAALLLISGSYLVLRWAYTGSASADYMGIYIDANPGSNDLVVGKASWSGGKLVSINYNDSSHPRTVPNIFDHFLKVIPTETAGNNVRVLPGIARAGSVSISVGDQLVALIPTYSAGTTVYIYVNDAGGISVSDDVEDYGGRVLLAKVVIPTSGGIDEDDITDSRCFLDASSVPVTITLTASTTLSDNDQIILCNNTAAITVTLPASPTTGRRYHIKKINTGNVTVAGNGNNIDGSTSQLIRERYDSMLIVFDGSNWQIH